LNDIKNKKDHFEKYTDLFIPSQVNRIKSQKAQENVQKW